MTDAIRLPKYTQRVLDRLQRGATLCRAVSATDEAVVKGGGFVYFTHPDNKPVPPATGRRMVLAGAVVPQGDGLLDGWSQTFVLNRSAEVKAGK